MKHSIPRNMPSPCSIRPITHTRPFLPNVRIPDRGVVDYDQVQPFPGLAMRRTFENTERFKARRFRVTRSRKIALCISRWRDRALSAEATRVSKSTGLRPLLAMPARKRLQRLDLLRQLIKADQRRHDGVQPACADNGPSELHCEPPGQKSKEGWLAL